MAKWWKRSIPAMPVVPVPSTDGAEARARSEIALAEAKELHDAVSQISSEFEFYNDRNHYISRVRKAWGAPDV